MQTIGIIKEAYNLTKTSRRTGSTYQDAKLLLETAVPPEIITISIPEEHQPLVIEWQKQYGQKLQVGIMPVYSDFNKKVEYQLYQNYKPELVK